MSDKASTNTQEKSFDSCFVLNERVLDRIMGVVENCLGNAIVTFKARLADGTDIEYESKDGLLKHDNTIKNPICSLAIIGRSTEFLLDFVCSFSICSHKNPRIRLRVTSKETVRAKQLYRELEEQIERTLLNGLIYKYKRSFVHFFLPWLFFGIVFVFVPTMLFTGNGRNGQLSASENAELAEKGRQIASPDEKLNFLFELRLKQIEADAIAVSNRQMWLNNLLTLKVLIILALFLAVAGGSYFLVISCYPLTIFDWGDCGDNYRELIRRRRLWWNIIIVVFVLGVVASLVAKALGDLFGL